MLRRGGTDICEHEGMPFGLYAIFLFWPPYRESLPRIPIEQNLPEKIQVSFQRPKETMNSPYCFTKKNQRTYSVKAPSLIAYLLLFCQEKALCYCVLGQKKRTGMKNAPLATLFINVARRSSWANDPSTVDKHIFRECFLPSFWKLMNSCSWNES